jgi:transposase
MKHKHEDYKLSAVLYHIENKTSYADTCAIFKCSERSLKRWKDNIIMRHGLLECKTCNRLWNRDMNASLNILKICKEAIAGKERPAYLKRSVRPLSDAASAITPTI